jgi:hypothetical protein
MSVLISESLPKEVLRNNYVSVLYHKEESLLTIKWLRQINLKERKNGFLWAYWFSCPRHIKNWLIDDNEIFLITPPEKEWVTYTWTRLVARSTIKKIAVVTPGNTPGILANVQFTESAQKQYESFGDTRHEVFTDYHMAQAWFREDF